MTSAAHNRSSPEFSDLIASVEDALAAFARQPDRVKALFGRYFKLMAAPLDAQPDLEPASAQRRTFSDDL